MTNLNISLDRSLKENLQLQLIRLLKQEINDGNLPKGTKLPSSRALANDLSVSRIITLTAYEQLIAEGYLISKTGSGTYISENIPEPLTKPTQKYIGPKWFKESGETIHGINNKQHDVEYDFTIGRPAVKLVPENSWKRAWRWALINPFSDNRTDPAGLYVLRKEIATYLKRTRSIHCSPDDIIITNGVADTLRLIARVTNEFSPITFAEFPGFPISWSCFSNGNHGIKPISIDENGLKVSELPTKKSNRPYMLFCTPSHQFPLGYRLSLKRRNEILNWANEHDALILEDDYDSEFHYDTMPLPTLKSQDKTGNVLYFSSFSKSISPNIKIGYLIAPEKLNHAIKSTIQQEHGEPNFFLQSAMANFIASGSLDKHIARSRRYYAKLNKIMREELNDLPDGVTLSGLDSGIHGFLSFNKHPEQLLKILKDKSFHLPLLPKVNNHDHTVFGFSLGYGHFDEKKLKKALQILKAEINKLYPEL